MKREILVVSFGTSYNNTRNKTIGATESAIAEAFPDYTIKRAFTSGFIIKKLKERDGIHIDDIRQGLERAIKDGVEEIILQPTHLMNGHEYEKIRKTFEEYKSSFASAKISTPLLSAEEDYEAVSDFIKKIKDEQTGPESAVILMGHGTDAASNSAYNRLQQTLDHNGVKEVFVGTVEAEPTINDILKEIQATTHIKNVLMMPLMVVAGDHANNDMAGDDDDSWKNIFEAAGYNVTCNLKGLGEFSEIHKIYIDHIKKCL